MKHQALACTMFAQMCFPHHPPRSIVTTRIGMSRATGGLSSTAAIIPLFWSSLAGGTPHSGQVPPSYRPLATMVSTVPSPTSSTCAQGVVASNLRTQGPSSRLATPGRSMHKTLPNQGSHAIGIALYGTSSPSRCTAVAFSSCPCPGTHLWTGGSTPRGASQEKDTAMRRSALPQPMSPAGGGADGHWRGGTLITTISCSYRSTSLLNPRWSKPSLGSKLKDGSPPSVPPLLQAGGVFRQAPPYSGDPTFR